MPRIGSSTLLLVLLVALIAGCDTTENEPVRVLIPRDVPSSQYTTTEEGVRIFDFRVGDGAVATDSSRIRAHYAAWVRGGDLIATSHGQANPITVDLDSPSIVEGWTIGVPGMRVGGDRQLVVPPSLAYGEQGSPEGGIPPNATIIYEIELLSVE